MPRRSVVFAVLSVIAAAVFVRLGLWQLDRLHQRRAYNAVVSARLHEPVATLDALPRSPEAARLRRVRVSGTADWAHEVIVAARTLDGAPGVWVMTPVHVAGSDTAVWVNRGWLYSPDGATVDLTTAHGSATTVDATGFALPFERGRGPAALRGRRLQRADSAALTADVPYPVLPFVIVAMHDSAAVRARPGTSRIPTPLEPPAIDEGPHMSYAIQWFAFALIAVVGSGIALIRRRGAPDA